MKNISDYVQSKLYKPINSQLRGSYYLATAAVIILTFISMGISTLEGPFQKSGEELALQLEWLFYFFIYMYPVGVIFTGYLATLQLKNMKKEEGDDKRYTSSKYDDEEEKYNFLLGIALIPFINVMGWIPILFIYPPAIITKSVFNVISKAKVYIFESFKNAIERMANKNTSS